MLLHVLHSQWINREGLSLPEENVHQLSSGVIKARDREIVCRALQAHLLRFQIVLLLHDVVVKVPNKLRQVVKASHKDAILVNEDHIDQRIKQRVNRSDSHLYPDHLTYIQLHHDVVLVEDCDLPDLILYVGDGKYVAIFVL